MKKIQAKAEPAQQERASSTESIPEVEKFVLGRGHEAETDSQG